MDVSSVASSGSLVSAQQAPEASHDEARRRAQEAERQATEQPAPPAPAAGSTVGQHVDATA